MQSSTVYLVILIIALMLLVSLVFVVPRKKQRKRLSALASLAFAFVLAGIFFGEERILGYSLIGIGVTLAIIDIINKQKANK